MTQHSPTLLVILDGFGHRDATEHNAIAQAKTPTWDHLWQSSATSLISASGADVGLPAEQMGNSEVGHMNLGAGRVIYQDLTRIDMAVADNTLKDNPVIQSNFKHLKIQNKALHIMGLLSPGGVHSHEAHIAHLIELAHQYGLNKVYLHAFLDGRDTPPQSAQASLAAIQDQFERTNCGQIASIVGRYYAMDRDKRWDRIEIAYKLLTQGLAEHQAANAIEALHAAYARGENDEFVQASVIVNENHQAIQMQDGDVAMFMNFRSDRARQLTSAFISPTFNEFERQHLPRLHQFASLTEYSEDLPSEIIFKKSNYANVLAEVLANQSKTQLHLAETEKYAHVTFFFNGGREAPFPGEDRKLIPSPKVATYDLQPEMSAAEVTDELVRAIANGQYDFIVCNYANADMVGHTGNMDAAVKAIECLDGCLSRIVAALDSVRGQMLVTADHGNAEQMFDEISQQAHTAHTNEEIPFLYYGKPATIKYNDGILADVAPTLLHLMGLTPPKEMTGRCLVELL